MRAFLALTLLIPSLSAHAGAHSETIFFLQPDGHDYLIERSIHSDSATHRFHLDKGIDQADLRHVSPARFEWDDAGDRVNSLHFDAGGFTIIYPGRFTDSELRQDKDGVLHYKSWDGQRDEQGRYGYWYAPGQFEKFSYTWILPDNIELLRYRCNQKGRWTRRNNAISFYAEQTNNLTFEMSYRLRSPSPDAITEQGPRTARPRPAPQAPRAVTASAIEPVSFGTGFATSDRDEDAVNDREDLCPGTPAGARVDRVGCPLDTDGDGVPDGVDRCIATPEGTRVDEAGCLPDAG